MTITPVHPGPGTYYAPRPGPGGVYQYSGSGTSLLSPIGAYQPTYGHGTHPFGFSSAEASNAPPRERVVDTSTRFGDEPEDVYRPPRSRFSVLPYGLSDYYRFQNLVRETPPTALRRQLEIHYGPELARFASNDLDSPFLQRGHAPHTWSDPERVRSFFDHQIAARTPPPSDMQWVRTDTGAAVSGPINGRLMQSPLFSTAHPVLREDPAGERQRDATGQTLIRPRDPADRPDSADRQLLRYHGALEQEGPGTPSWARPTIPPEVMAEDGDLFSQMQTQIERDLERSALGAEPGTERFYFRPPAATQPGQEIQTLKTFVGDGPAPVNTYLEQAERALKDGRYYRAAGTYDLARAADPGNPLPLLGRAMALLAAGEYMTSATNLFLAIRQYEPLAYYRVDLRAFVPDLRMLDRRRADLEQRLAQGEDFRLRFLLGYAEYCSGFDELGLENMTRAAEAAPEEMHEIRRFVRILGQLNPPPTP